ncbi:hypothetical protein SBOR_1180 [Sclerotinia borealis F-4128]|uniref:Uncharacterized protein n=1 Tax=Sclerotinia borealis (strain F-4128) TaxID=1432307 RepID=W9CR11_SCLBF|nr:hypothetical protein SBOR_1180 [Sclerotinia borealis F-4128]
MTDRPTLVPPPPINPSKSAIENVLELRELSQIGPDIFTNTHPLWHPPGARGIYGGAIIAQCLAAAQCTVPHNFTVHSMHCYFVLAGNSDLPVMYYVEHVREGRSFATRTVQARQKGKCIFTTTMSFVRENSGGKQTVEHAVPIPKDIRQPKEDEELFKMEMNTDSPFISQRIEILNGESGTPHEKRTRQWIKARGRISDEGGHQAHLNALAYMSDSYFIGTVGRIHKLWRYTSEEKKEEKGAKNEEANDDEKYMRKLKESEGFGDDLNNEKRRPEVGMMVSLDHTIYFHEPRRFRADEWMFTEMSSPWSGDGRGVVTQHMFAKDGTLIATCFQEGVPRVTSEAPVSRNLGAVDVKPNSSELSYLLFYATTRRSKVQKVGEFLEKKTASDVWRARIGNVQVTLQILAALIEKAPRDLPLYAPYVLKIFNIILRARDVTMVESSIPTFEVFCENHDMASLSADQEYLHQYEEIVRIYASFASTRTQMSSKPQSAPVTIRWRSLGLQAVKSVASSEALATVAGRQLDVIVPILLENIWTDNEDFLEILQQRAETEEHMGTDKSLLKRRTSNATVRTVDTAGENSTALSGTTADADKLAEENIGVLAMQCLKQIFVVNNRSQIHGAATAVLKFISDRVTQQESVIENGPIENCKGWAPRIFEMIARWTPVQDRYVILVTAMDSLVRTDQVEATLMQQLVLATMVDSLLKSDINLIGLSVMDVLLGLIQHILIVLQLGNIGGPHLQPDSGVDEKYDANPLNAPITSEPALVPTDTRKDLMARLQNCIGALATHVYYADQISDMVSVILLRLKPSPLSPIPNTVAAIEDPTSATEALSSGTNMTEDPNTDGFFSFDTAKIKALESIKLILLVASHKTTTSGNFGRNRVPIKTWEGTQWLLRDVDGRVRKAYTDALLTWLDMEVTKADQHVPDEKSKGLTKSARDESATNLAKRAVSNASRSEKPSRSSRTTFLELLHLAIYENALQFADNENDIVLLHLLLTNLVKKLGVNAVRSGLPMMFRLQEDIELFELPVHKVRLGSLCHGYFWTLCEKFEIGKSPIGKTVQDEIRQRQKAMFWVDSIRFPPVQLPNIGTPGRTTPQQKQSPKYAGADALAPFDDRFQMVKLISLSYATSMNSPPNSPPTSPGRSFTHPILSVDIPSSTRNTIMPERIKEEMMSEWNKESVIAVAQESTKTASINGSRAGTMNTGHRNFLTINGLGNGSNSGTASPTGGHNTKSGPNSTYGTTSGIGAMHKLRKGNEHSPGPASESSRGSVMKVDQLKRVFSGQSTALPGTRAGAPQSDASSESMVSYDLSTSEISINTYNQQNASGVERSASMRSAGRSRSKSRDRVPRYLERSLTSNPTDVAHDGTTVPPVPPLPPSLVGEHVSVHDQAHNHSSEGYRPGRSARRSTKSRAGGYPSMPWGEENGKVVDLQNLLSGIEVGGDEKGNAGMPPY